MPDCARGLPSTREGGGEGRGPMYRELVRLHREGLVDFSQVTAFNLDEYLGIPPDHPQSFKSYMRQHLWDHVNLRKENVHIPSSLPKNPDQECAHYESLIQEAGGIDLAVLGLGTNGHIGFNEPGTPFESLPAPLLSPSPTWPSFQRRPGSGKPKRLAGSNMCRRRRSPWA